VAQGKRRGRGASGVEIGPARPHGGGYPGPAESFAFGVELRVRGTIEAYHGGLAPDDRQAEHPGVLDRQSGRGAELGDPGDPPQLAHERAFAHHLVHPIEDQDGARRHLLGPDRVDPDDHETVAVGAVDQRLERRVARIAAVRQASPSTSTDSGERGGKAGASTASTLGRGSSTTSTAQRRTSVAAEIDRCARGPCATGGTPTGVSR
jgi:hypothetical protein